MPAASCRPSPPGSNQSSGTDCCPMSLNDRQRVNVMATTTTNRIFNFSAGPAVLPLPVLEQAQRELVALPGVGMSVMEISHRSKTFEDILSTALADLRELTGMPSNYQVLMLQGGASLQFSMVQMNLLAAGAAADYVDTGTW